MSSKSVKSGKVSNSSPAENLSGKLIFDRFKLSEVIGQGSFGSIRLAEDMSNNKMVAVKVEKSKERSSLLMEYKFYRKLLAEPMVGTTGDGIPDVLHYGQYLKYDILVMELLGPNLLTVFNDCGQQFSLKTIIYIFVQLLQRLQRVHECKIVYRDIKPENFVLGQEWTAKWNIIHIVDFGLAKQYWNEENNSHIKMTEYRTLTGTSRYMSINAHLGKELSRRDDLESLGYMMMYFVRQGDLPWMGLKADTLKERSKKICLMKRGTPIEKLCFGFPEPFADYLRNVRSLEFHEKPNYTFLISLFAKLFEREKLKDDGFYDWDPKEHCIPS